jgi:hypothetical protein
MRPEFTAMSYWFRVLAILSAITVAIELIFWIGDRITGLPFRGYWLLGSSVFWSVLFYFLSRRSAIRK